MGNLYRITELQLDKILQNKNVTKNIDEESINEIDGNADVFTAETTNINLYYEGLNSMFKDYIKPGTKNVILVGGNEFDIYINIYKAIAKYGLSIDYMPEGIQSIELIPIGISLMGILDLTGDDDSFEESFEITIEGDKIKDNTLSGEFSVGGYGNINIGDLAVSNVMLTSKRLSNNQGFYLTGIEINEKAGGFLIEFQY
jgi:hypothetical protein